ncbi:MAG: ribosome maturation factor RimP [Syntrophobacteraceae bacterium]
MTQELKRDPRELVGDLWRLAEPVIGALGMEILDIEYRRESMGWVVRIFLDSDRGITVEDCARVSRAVGDLLDATDMIPTAYNLEVSSPGIDRPLRKLEHFQKHLDDIIEVKTVSAVQNRRNFKGALKEASPAGVVVECDSQDYLLAMELIERARLLYFESLERKSR